MHPPKPKTLNIKPHDHCLGGTQGDTPQVDIIRMMPVAVAATAWLLFEA